MEYDEEEDRGDDEATYVDPTHMELVYGHPPAPSSFAPPPVDQKVVTSSVAFPVESKRSMTGLPPLRPPVRQRPRQVPPHRLPLLSQVRPGRHLRGGSGRVGVGPGPSESAAPGAKSASPPGNSSGTPPALTKAPLVKPLGCPIAKWKAFVPSSCPTFGQLNSVGATRPSTASSP